MTSASVHSVFQILVSLNRLSPETSDKSQTPHLITTSVGSHGAAISSCAEPINHRYSVYCFSAQLARTLADYKPSLNHQTLQLSAAEITC